jgi:polar amino acid transport system substrate-binding protein
VPQLTRFGLFDLHQWDPDISKICCRVCGISIEVPDVLVNANMDGSFLQIAKMACLARGLLIFLVVSAAGLIASDKSSANDTLRLAADVWLPYENISNTEAPGFSTEVVSAVLAGLEIGTTIQEAPWARGLDDVFNGKVDALFSAFWTEERARYCLYPDEPLMSEKWMFFVRSEKVDDLSFTSYDQIRNRRIGILRGASVTEEFWGFVKENANYEEVETDDLNFKKLYRKRLDYVVTSYSNGMMLLKKMNLTAAIRPLPSPVIKEDNLYIIFSKKTVSPQLVGRFSATLRDFKTTDAYRVIYEKYFGLSGH